MYPLHLFITSLFFIDTKTLSLSPSLSHFLSPSSLRLNLWKVPTAWPFHISLNMLVLALFMYPSLFIPLFLFPSLPLVFSDSFLLKILWKRNVILEVEVFQRSYSLSFSLCLSLSLSSVSIPLWSLLLLTPHPRSQCLTSSYISCPLSHQRVRTMHKKVHRTFALLYFVFFVFFLFRLPETSPSVFGIDSPWGWGRHILF